MNDGSDISRRALLKRTGVASVASAQGAEPKVAMIADPSDPVAGAAPVRWAVKDLEGALTAAGSAARKHK